MARIYPYILSFKSYTLRKHCLNSNVLPQKRTSEKLWDPTLVLIIKTSHILPQVCTQIFSERELFQAGDPVLETTREDWRCVRVTGTWLPCGSSIYQASHNRKKSWIPFPATCSTHLAFIIKETLHPGTARIKCLEITLGPGSGSRETVNKKNTQGTAAGGRDRKMNFKVLSTLSRVRTYLSPEWGRGRSYKTGYRRSTPWSSPGDHRGGCGLRGGGGPREPGRAPPPGGLGAAGPCGMGSAPPGLGSGSRL